MNSNTITYVLCIVVYSARVPLPFSSSLHDEIHEIHRQKKEAAVFPFKRVCPTFTFKQVNVMMFICRELYIRYSWLITILYVILSVDRKSLNRYKLSFNNEFKGIHRIPYGRTALSRQKGPKRPVFLQHGLLNSDADWLINPTDRALGNYTFFSLFFCTQVL